MTAALAEGYAGAENSLRPCKPFSAVPFQLDPDFVDLPDLLAWIRDLDWAEQQPELPGENNHNSPVS